jgi:hypothetical protein
MFKNLGSDGTGGGAGGLESCFLTELADNYLVFLWVRALDRPFQDTVLIKQRFNLPSTFLSLSYNWRSRDFKCLEPVFTNKSEIPVF